MHVCSFVLAMPPCRSRGFRPAGDAGEAGGPTRSRPRPASSASQPQAARPAIRGHALMAVPARDQVSSRRAPSWNLSRSPLVGTVSGAPPTNLAAVIGIC